MTPVERSERVVMLHIGMHKTGTSSFQIRCDQLRDDLKARGLLYPKAGIYATVPGHATFAWDLAQLMTTRANAGAVAEVLGEIREADVDRVLISAEDLSLAWCHPDRLRWLRSAFEAEGFEVHVLMCQREGTEFQDSLYGQLVRGGLGRSRIDFHREAEETGKVQVPSTAYFRPRTFCVDPSRLRRTFSEAFGEDQVHVIDYRPEGMVHQIVESQGWFFGEEATLFSEGWRVNESGGTDVRRELEDRLAALQSSRVWRWTSWTRAPRRRALWGRLRAALPG